MQMGGAVAGKEALTLEEFATAFEAGIGGVQRIGKAEPGDKTMVDALIPARDALTRRVADGASVGDAVARMAAGRRRRACSPPSRSSPARAGRATSASGRAGHQDPGATSSYLLLRSAADVWAGR